MFDPARHEPLTDTPWDEARGRAVIAAIATDVEAAFDEHALWPKHPLDDDVPGPSSFKSLYLGGRAGMPILDVF